MSALFESLQRLSKFQVDQATPLLTLAWTPQVPETELDEILSKLQQSIAPLYPDVSAGISNNAPFTVASLPFWINAALSGVKALEKRVDRFIDDILAPFVRSPPAITPTFGTNDLELTGRACVESLVVLSQKGERKREIFETLLPRPIPASVENALTFGHKSRDSATWNVPADQWALEVAVWTCEKLLVEKLSILTYVEKDVVDKFVSNCFDYLLRPSHVIVHHHLTIHRLLPHILSAASDRERLWNFLLRVSAQSERDHFEPLLYAILVQYYDVFMPVLPGEAFDIRENQLFFSWIFAGLVQTDLTCKKRATYLLKRLVQSSASSRPIRTPWFVFSDKSAIFDKYLLLLDSLEDHDLQILKSMWVQFYEILERSADDLVEADGEIHLEFLRVFLENTFISDSKPLRRYVQWTLFASTHPCIGRLFASLDFMKALLSQVGDVIGVKRTNPLVYALFSDFFSRCLTTLPSDTARLAYVKELLLFALNERVSGQCLAVLFAFLADSKHSVNKARKDDNSQQKSGASDLTQAATLLLFDDALLYVLLNCFQSVFLGVSTDLQEYLFVHAIRALPAWIDTRKTRPSTIVQLILAVPSFYARKPHISRLLSTLLPVIEACASEVAVLPEPSSESQSKDGSPVLPRASSDSWLEWYLQQKAVDVFNQPHFSSTERSTLVLRSFKGAETAADVIATLVPLLSPSLASQALVKVFDALLKRSSSQSIDEIVFVGHLWSTARKSSYLWPSFSCFMSSHPKVSTLASSLQELLIAFAGTTQDDTATAAVNLAKERNALYSAAATLAPIFQEWKLPFEAAATLSTQHQALAAPNTSSGPFEMMAQLGSLADTAVLQHLPDDMIMSIVMNVMAFEWPGKASQGIDGPTWKILAGTFDTGRWQALALLGSVLRTDHFLGDRKSSLQELLDLLVQHCQQMAAVNIATIMRVLKSLLSLLPTSGVEADTLTAWIFSVIKSLKQEKTFTSRQIYHLLAVVYTPSLLLCLKYSSAISAITFEILKISETTRGIANFVAQLFSSAFASSSADHEDVALRLVPVFFKLATFGGNINQGASVPFNADLEEAGFRGEPSDPFVRSTTLVLIATRLSRYPRFVKQLFLYCIGLADDQGFATGSIPPFEAVFIAGLPTFRKQKSRRCSFANILDYRRFQLATLLAQSCEISCLIQFWPLLAHDHLVQVRELVTLTASVLLLRTLTHGDDSAQAKVFELLIDSSTDRLQGKSALLENEDVTFAWLSVAGFALQSADLIKHKHLIQSWKKLFHIILPFLSYNSLYLRSTAQDLLLNVMASKEQQLAFFDSDMLTFLTSTKNFVLSTQAARPLTKSNRRELFYSDLIKCFLDEDNPNEATKQVLRQLISLHPEQHDYPVYEYIPIARLDKELAEDGLNDFGRSSTSLEAKYEQEGPVAWKNEEERATFVAEFLLRAGEAESKSSSSIVNGDSQAQNFSTQPQTFQRKIVPWQSIDLKEKSSSSKQGQAPLFTSQIHVIDLDKSQRMVRGRQNLIIVASLLQKMPNFGGITRTAEIFAASKLVLPSLSILQDKTFKDLSVSSELWLPMEEVTPAQLPAWLQTKRSEGFKIVGVEQTSNSISLEAYNFHNNTILVLGEEKHGIPVDLIQLLDECVEIPQLGVIRSLNVHVSASIMIWEYTKQHMK